MKLWFINCCRFASFLKFNLKTKGKSIALQNTKIFLSPGAKSQRLKTIKPASKPEPEMEPFYPTKSATYSNRFTQPTDLVSQCKTFAKHAKSLKNTE